MEEIMEIIFKILFCQIYEIFAKFLNANQLFIFQFIITFASLAAILCILRANRLSPTTFFTTLSAKMVASERRIEVIENFSFLACRSTLSSYPAASFCT